MDRCEGSGIGGPHRYRPVHPGSLGRARVHQPRKWRCRRGRQAHAGSPATGSACAPALPRRFAAPAAAGETLASVTVALPRDADPTAIAAASRRPGEPRWFGFEQPDRDGFALGRALGCVAKIDERGPERFARVARRWRELAAHAASDDPGGPRPQRRVRVGGFAFAPEGGTCAYWAGCTSRPRCMFPRS